jgi:hypothetical protein
MSRWFRMYDELLDDPKVQRLAPEDFKGWVNLLCLASRNNGKLPKAEDIAFALRETAESVSSLFHRLESVGLVVSRNGTYSPYKWAERQYKSDTSTDRVKRFRERCRNADETAPEAETELDTDIPPIAPRKRGECAGVNFPQDWQLPPVPSLTPKARACAEQWTLASYETEGEGFALYWKQSRKRRPDWLGTWCAWVIRQHSKVMRDQKFGNAPPAQPKKPTGPMTVDELRNGIRFRRDIGDEAKAQELEAELEKRLAA